METENKQQNRIEVVEKLYNLIDQRNRLMLHVSNLKKEYNSYDDPYTKESIETIYIEFIQEVKRINKRITLLDESLKKWSEVE